MKHCTVNILLSLLLLTSCSDYAKVVKSSDYDLKWSVAKQYYEDGKYARSIELLEEVMPRFRFTDDAEEMLWIYANCFYKMSDYYSAVEAFQNFFDTYQYGPHAEEAYFYIGMCNYIISPRAELDQENSLKAINDFSFFITKYPNSDKIHLCDSLRSELQERLVEKSYISARLYYDMDKYKSAIVALTNSLNLYSQSKYREEMMYLKLDSYYKYAEKSVAAKKKERYQDTLEEYFSFMEEFPQSSFSKDVRKIYQSTARFLNIDINDPETISEN